MSHLVCLPEKWRTSLITTSEWPDHLIAAGLALAFSAIVLGVPQTLPLQAASWLTFIGVVITPGYFLGELLVGRAPLDRWERLSLAFPLGMAAIAPAGMASLLLHLTVRELAVGWSMTVGVILAVWLLTTRWMRRPAPRLKFSPWQWDELAMLLLLIAAFVYMFPTLSLYKMDGDAYAVATFTSDALTGRPMNATEPVLGTGQNVSGLRMGFNQLLAVFHLWSYLSGSHHIELLGNASRSMLALWAMLASYTMGKAAGNGSRRFGLLTISFQTLIYLAAPFMRTDSVSIFFFERINADKFTVTVTMLPVVIAFAIRFVREGRRDYWITAAVGAFAVSSIHALIAAMLALALGAFGGVHLLLNLRRRVAWRRVIGLALVVAVTMGLPLIQLVIAQSSDALAPTYPSTFEGWSVGKRSVPVLPFVLTPNVDYYGPLPNLAYLTPDAANESTNPFLIWRFALNMRRQRLILFDLDHYISDPTTILEPPYLLALLLLPVLLFKLRSNLGAQYAVGTSLAVLVVMFNPILTPILGGLVMPWILWRFVWLLPYALIFALVATPLLNAVVGFLARLRPLAPHRDELLERAPLALVILCALCLWPNAAANIQSIQARGAGPFVYGTPSRLLARLQEEVSDGPPVMVMSDQNLSVTIPSFVGNADIVAHRILSTAEMMGAEDQDVALERHLDQYNFLYTPLLTTTHLDILKKYDVRYIVLPNGTNLDAQLRLSPQWFEWLIDDQGYSLYAVRELPEPTLSMAGNLAMLDYRWDEALEAYESALEQDPTDMLALLGTASVHAISGQFDLALAALRETLALSDSPVLHYRLGQVYGDMGEVESSIVEFYEALRGAPAVPQFHMALADACLNAGQVACAQSEFEAALDAGGLTDEVQRHTRLAAIWQQRGKDDLALAHYEQAAEIRPNESTQLLLASAHQRRGDYERAEEVLATLRKEHPLSATVLAASARLLANQGDVDGAIALYQRAIRLQAVLAQDTRTTRLDMAQTLFDQNRLGESRDAVEEVLRLDPQNTSAYLLLGNLYRQETQPAMAMEAYRKALQLDPTDAAAYVSLNDQFRQQAIPPEETLALMETAAEVSSQQSLFSLSLADQFRRLGDVDMSIATYKLVLGLLDAESSAETLESNKRNRAVAFSRLGALHEDIGELDVALSYYRAAVAVAPTQTWAQVALGDALRRRNQVDAAEAAYRAVIEREPSNVEAHLRLADLFGAQGDSAAASELYRQAIETALAESDPTRRSRALQSLSSLYIQYYVAESPIGSDYEPLTDLATEDPISQQALEAYAQALELESSVAGVSLLARLSLEQGNAERAIELYQQSIRLAEQEGGGPSLLAQYHVGLGDAYLAIDRADAALDAYRTAVELDGWWPTARLALARAWTDLGDQESALAELQAAAQIAPGSVETQLALAELLDERGEHEQALEIYEATVQAHPGNMAANLGLARALQSQSLWVEAESRYRHAMTMVANDVEPYAGLADLLILQGQFEEAEALLRTAIDLDRRDPTAYLRLGELLASRLRFTEAFDVYRQAIQASPGDWQPYASLAGIYRTLGDVESAQKSYQQAAVVDATAVAPLLQLAGLYLDQNQPDQAEEVFILALERSPGDAAIRQALAEFYQSMGLGEEALLQLRLAAEENPHSTTVLIAYANQLRLLGREEEANDLYRQAEESPEPSAAGYRALALTYETRGEWEEALAWLDRAMELAPNEAANWIQKGELEVQMGRVEEGLASLERATQLGPGQGQTWYALGNTLLSLGQIDEAASALEQAIAVEPTYLPAYGALVEIYQQLGQDERLVNLITQAKLAVPGSYLGYLYDAQYLQSQLQWEKARAALAQAIARALGDPGPYVATAQLEERLGNMAQAFAWYEQAASLRPGESLAVSQYIDLLFSRGENLEALAQTELALRAQPGNAELLLRLGRLQRALGQYPEAKASLEKGIRSDPSRADLWAEVALLHLAQGDPQEALAAYDRAIALEPGQESYYGAKSTIVRAQGQPKEALALLENALPKVAEPTSLYAALSGLYLEQGNPEQALSILEQGLEALGDESDLLSSLASYYESQARFDQAEESYQRGVTLHPDEAGPYLALARFLQGRGRLTEAEDAYEQALALEPSNAEVYRAFGDLHRLAGRSDKAAEAYSLALAFDPRSEEGYIGQAALYREQGRWDEARAIYEKGLSILPISERLLTQYSELLLQRGDEEGALRLREQALNVSKSASAYLSRADLYRRMGRTNEARADLRSALEVEPGSVDALLTLGDLESQSRAALAEQYYRQAAALAPGTAMPHLRLADLAYRQGRLAEAWREFETAARVQPASAEAWGQRAEALREAGDWQAAEAAYRQAILRTPLSMETYVELATLTQNGSGGLPEALGWLQQASRMGVDQGTVYLAFAELYRGAGQARQAEIYLERARLADPASSEAELALADFYLSQGRPETAQRHAASALSLAPAEPATHILSARISHALGDLGAAESHYRRAIAVDATRMDGYLALAEFYRVQERTSQAIAIYEQIVDATPLDWSAWVSLGNLYAEMGNENDALLAYGKAIEINASVPEPWFGQGDVYMDQGLASAALAAYRQAETLRPGQAAPLLRLAGFYEQEGDLDQAETYARRAIAADPSAAAYLTLGRILGAQEDPEAADAYLRSIQQDPRQVSVYNAWIALHTDILQRPYRLDRSRLAVALGELAGSDDSGALWALTLLGRGYYALEGATDRSIGYLEGAQRLDPTFADLYQDLAWAYEQRLDGPHALDLWRRYLYAVTGRGDTAEAEAHITMLLQIQIDKPAAGAPVSGAVEIAGTAAPDGFQYYKLAYRRADGQGDWHGIGEPVYQQVRGGLLGTWSTGNLAPGKYWLRLIVVDTTGNEKPYDEVQVTVKGAG